MLKIEWVKKYDKLEEELDKKFDNQLTKIAEDYTDRLMKESSISKMSWHELEKYANKVYNPEHEEYRSSWGVDTLIRELSGNSNKFKYDYHTGEISRK